MTMQFTGWREALFQGLSLCSVGLHQDAIIPLETAITLAKKAKASPRELISIWNARGDAIQGGERPFEALPCYEEAMHLAETSQGDYEEIRAVILLKLGKLLHKRHSFQDSFLHLNEALIRFRLLHGEQHENTARTLHALAEHHHEKQEFEAASKLYKETLSIQIKLFGADHTDILATRHDFANHLISRGEINRAFAMHESILEARRRRLGFTHPDVAQSMADLGAMFHRLGQSIAGQSMIQEAVSMLEQMLGAQHPMLKIPLENLGTIAWNNKDYEAATLYDSRSLEISENSGERQGVFSVMLMSRLSRGCVLSGRVVEGEYYNERCRKIVCAWRGGERLMIPILQDYCNVLVQKNQRELARQHLKEAMAIARQYDIPNFARFELLSGILAEQE